MWVGFLEKNSSRRPRIKQWNIFWRSWFGAAWLVVKLDIVDGTVNVTKCIGTAEVRGAISIALFQKAYPFCLKDDNEPCHVAKLVSNWKCQNNTRTLTSPAQLQDRISIENLWRKITLETVKRHPTIKRKLIEPPGTRELPTTTSSRCPLNSDTMLKSDY